MINLHILLHECTNIFFKFVFKHKWLLYGCHLQRRVISNYRNLYGNSQLLGHGFSEIVYKDALELEFRKAGIFYEREKEYEVVYKGIILPHKFYADFVIDKKIILEIKGKNQIADADLAQAINYLKVSENKLALIVNFGELKLNYKRIIL